MHADPETGQLVNGIKKVRYSHDAMIDLLIAEPTIRQNDLAAIFDRTPTWVSLVINSDAFQARLAERRAELVDPTIAASINERLSALADATLTRLLDRVTTPVQVVSDDFLLRTAEVALKASGYGARPQGPAVNVGVVVQVPQKSSSEVEWITAHSPIPPNTNALGAT